MGVISITREYEINAQTMWQVISDFSNFHKVSRVVEAVELLSSNEKGVNAKRRNLNYSGQTFVQTVVEWIEKDMYYKFKVDDVYPPLKSIHSSFQVSEVDENSCKVTVKGYFSVIPEASKSGIETHIEHQSLLSFESILAGFNHFILTGKEVSERDSLETLKVATVS